MLCFGLSTSFTISGFLSFFRFSLFIVVDLTSLLNDLTQQMLRLKKRKVKQKKKIHCFAFKQKIHQKIFLHFQLDCLMLTKSFSKSSSLNLRRSQLRHRPKIVSS